MSPRFRTILFATVILLVIAVSQRVPAPSAISEAFSEPAITDSRVTPITAQEVLNRLAAAKAAHKPVVLFIYTSWCPHCQKQTPEVGKLAADWKQNGIGEVLALSVDKDQVALANYLQHVPETASMTHYHLAPQEKNFMKNVIRHKQGEWQGPIPYTALFDRDGDLVHDTLGAIPAVQFHAMAKQLTELPK